VRLAETQAVFRALVTGGDAPAGAAERIAVSTPGLDAEERVGIYAGMYRARLVEALAADFPKLKRLLGDERFWALGVAYAAEHPSEDADIGRFGRELAAFLRSHPAPDRADLADLAALEWARSEVFFDAPAEPIGREALALEAAAFPVARLRFAPALRLVTGDHAAAPLWRALEVGDPAPPPAPAAEAIAVWRSGFDVFHATLDPAEATALARALAGEPLGCVCAAFAGRPDAAEAAFAALSSWVDDGWVAGVDAPPARAA
jgi:hypothetical protein